MLLVTVGRMKVERVILWRMLHNNETGCLDLRRYPAVGARVAESCHVGSIGCCKRGLTLGIHAANLLS